MPKIIKDAFADEKGNITSVLFKGNKTPTPLETALRMAERDEIKDVHVSHTGHGRPYLRTNPNGKKEDNLDHLAGDH